MGSSPIGVANGFHAPLFGYKIKHGHALVTQLVECNTCNVEVAGSNPVGGSNAIIVLIGGHYNGKSTISN